MPIEVDNRYPEVARPYEPVGKGEHHKKLLWGKPLAAVSLVLILLTTLLSSLPSTAPEPTPEPSPAPVPVPTIVVPTPIPEPTPEPTPVPEPVPDPELAPAPAPTPAPTPASTTPSSSSSSPSSSTPATTQYTITFVDWDGTTISSAKYDDGTFASSISVPADPTRPNDGSYRYAFAGWTPAFADVTTDATYTATYTEEVIPWYAITSVDYDGTTVLKSETWYQEGTAAADIDQPPAPTRAPEGGYEFTFSGWSPALSDVTANVTYTAVYDSDKIKYTITWNNYGGAFIDETTVEEGETPVHADPTYGPTDQYIFTFNAWSPAIVPATADTTYTANYTTMLRQYTVSFVDWDGSSIDSATYEYGTPAASISVPADPTRSNDANYSYSFAAWTPTIADVTGDATYTATYDATPISYGTPAIDDITDVQYNHQSAGSIAQFSPVVTLNDVAGNTGRLRLLQQNPDDPNGDWIELTLGDDEAANAVTIEYNNGTDWVTLPTPSGLNAEYDIPDDAVALRASMTRNLVPPGGAGAIRQKVQVAFDYTLPNGDTGTVKGNEFYLYRGSFAQRSGAPVLDRDAKTITMDFKYQLVEGGEIDPNNVTWTGHHLYTKAKTDTSSEFGTEIMGLTPTVTHSDVDGVHHVTITYTLDEVSDDLYYTYKGDLLDDEWGDPSHWNNWNTNAYSYEMEFPTASSGHAAPLSLEPGPAVSHSYGGDSEDYTVGFMMMSKNLNDAKDGRIALRIERYDESSGSWVSPVNGFVSYANWQANNEREWDDPDKQMIYDAQTIWGVTVATMNPDDPIEPSNPTTLDDLVDPTQLFDVDGHTAVYAIFAYHFPYEYWYGTRITLRTVMDVEYSDGSTETIASTPFYVYGGSFVEPNSDFGNYGMQIDKDNKILTLEYVYDTDVMTIDPANVRWVSDDEEIANCNYLYYGVNYTGWWPASRAEDWEQLTYLDIKPTASERDEGGKHIVTLTFDLSSAPAELWADPDHTYLFYSGSAYYQDSGEYFGVWQDSPDKGFIPVWQFVE